MSSVSVTAPATTDAADLQTDDEASRTLLDLLTTEKMDGSDPSAVATSTATPIGSDSSSQGQLGRWGTLKQRLGLNAIICCGGGWAHHNRSFSDALLPAVHEDYDDPEADEDHSRPSTPDDRNEEPTTNILGTPGVNLATALAEERQSRQLATMAIPPAEVEAEGEIFSSVPGTPTPAKVSLMRLMAEAAVEDEEVVVGELASGGAGSCCVCMERKKGAAFIPCGHTFCRVCSRELWLNRGSCPLCNRSILDVLDIF